MSTTNVLRRLEALELALQHQSAWDELFDASVAAYDALSATGDEKYDILLDRLNDALEAASTARP